MSVAAVPEGRTGGFVPVRLVVLRKDKTGVFKHEKVADIRVPSFSPMPQVIIWGARSFIAASTTDQPEDGPDVYVEAFAYWTNLTTGLVAQGA